MGCVNGCGWWSRCVTWWFGCPIGPSTASWSIYRRVELGLSCIANASRLPAALLGAPESGAA